MTRLLKQILCEPAFAEEMASNGLQTIRSRHTCGHRVGELLEVVAGYRNISLNSQFTQSEVTS